MIWRGFVWRKMAWRCSVRGPSSPRSLLAELLLPPLLPLLVEGSWVGDPPPAWIWS